MYVVHHCEIVERAGGTRKKASCSSYNIINVIASLLLSATAPTAVDNKHVLNENMIFN